MDSTSDAAHAAWSSRYGGTRFELPLSSLEDSGPFELAKKLGEGGWGNVYRTELGGVSMALKLLHLFPNKQRHIFVNELRILQKLSGRRHRHVIEFVGCFELIGKLRSRVGLLLWPVAQCDLSNVLHYMDILSGLKARLMGTLELMDISQPLDGEESDALNMLTTLTVHESLPQKLSKRVQLVHAASKRRLYAIFGCLAHTISYLHDDQRIRHKDLNPKQILLSSQGLWLTDFGLSKDISELSNSATNNGEKISIRYHAPERESKGRLPCGRSEDTFALGCTFLEICYRLHDLPIEDYLNPQGLRSWTYQANLDQIDN